MHGDGHALGLTDGRSSQLNGLVYKRNYFTIYGQSYEYSAFVAQRISEGTLAGGSYDETISGTISKPYGVTQDANNSGLVAEVSLDMTSMKLGNFYIRF